MCHYRLKLGSVFLIGFGIGFTLALLLLLAQNLHYACHRTPSYSPNRRPTLLGWFLSDTNSQTLFQTWKGSVYDDLIKDKGLKPRDVDLDSYLYGPESKMELEADWLKSQVHITCVVFVKRIKLARAIRDTWGKRCDGIYFFGQERDPDVPVISFDVKLMSSWQLLCEAFAYIWRDKPSRLQWLLFVKDDTLAIPENLRYMLAPLNHTQDYYLGHAVVLWGQAYNVADAGYVISSPVLRKLIKKFDNSEKCLAGGKYWKQEDYYLAKHLASMGIHPSDTRDQYLRGTFHGYSLQSLLWGVVKTGVYWNRALYPIKNECCSFASVTFTVAEPDKMHTFNYLLYHFHVLNKKAAFGSRPAARTVPDEDVWKIALKEEFNITHLQDISSDDYYKIWHAKYSEPEQLINMNYRSKHN